MEYMNDARLYLLISLAPLGFAVGVFVPLAIWAERKIAGWVQARIGPNRVGPFGLLQSLADAFKLITKEDLIPTEADPGLFRLAVYLVVAGATASFMIVPFGPNWIGSTLELGLFWYLAAGSIVTVGIVMAGWASNNKWSLLGGARSAAQVVSYEIAVGLSLLPAIFLTGSLRPQEIILNQGPYPWQWHLFHSPGLFACFFMYFIAALAEVNRTPFDLPEAESELVSGYNTGPSGLRWALFMLGEYTDIYLIAAITATVFLGGWMHPWALEWSSNAPTLMGAWEVGTVWADAGQGGLLMFLANNLFGLIAMMTKSLLLVVVVILLRWTLPRLRVDQLMAVCWKYLVPLSLVAVLATAVWMLFVPETLTISGFELPTSYNAVRGLQQGSLLNGNWVFFPIGVLVLLLPMLAALRRNRRYNFEPAYGKRST